MFIIALFVIWMIILHDKLCTVHHHHHHHHHHHYYYYYHHHHHHYYHHHTERDDDGPLCFVVNLVSNTNSTVIGRFVQDFIYSKPKNKSSLMDT